MVRNSSKNLLIYWQTLKETNSLKNVFVFKLLNMFIKTTYRKISVCLFDGCTEKIQFCRHSVQFLCEHRIIIHNREFKYAYGATENVFLKVSKTKANL